MINFFRKIRQRLFLEGHTGKSALSVGRYLKYALGEIFLVVLGILIALGINNWNEDRKADNAEKIVLNNIAENLALDSDQFDYYTSQYRHIDNLHVELYKAGLSDERAEIISEPLYIRRTLYFKQLIGPDFKDHVFSIRNSKIKEALIKYTRSVEDMENVYWNQLTPLVEQKLKPYLAEQRLYNIENWFELENRTFKDYTIEELNGKDLIDEARLIELAGTKAFQQLLFEVNVKWNDFFTRLETVIEENNRLRRLIHSELENY